jgi:AcrR family transcriptional regulator
MDVIRKGSLDRRARQKAETRTAILDAARALFVKHGVADTTMRAIAARIGYTPTAIYHHFRDKEALLFELCVKDFTAFGAALHSIGQIADPLDRLRQMARAYVRFAVANPQQYRLLFMTDLPPAIAGSELESHYPGEGAYHFLEATAAEAIAKQQLRPGFDSAQLVAQLVWSGMHGLAALWMTHADDDVVHLQPPEAVVDAMCDALMNGLTSERVSGHTTPPKSR